MCYHGVSILVHTAGIGCVLDLHMSYRHLDSCPPEPLHRTLSKQSVAAGAPEPSFHSSNC